jgi:iron complex transport system ATP-binding protein
MNFLQSVRTGVVLVWIGTDWQRFSSRSCFPAFTQRGLFQASFLFDSLAPLAVDSTVQEKRKRAPIVIFILAGGKSSRMGRDKARLPMGNRSFLQVITESARELDAPIEVIFDDDLPGCGPLGGIATAFNRFRFGEAVFLSCDMPLVSAETLKQLVQQSQSGNFACFTNCSFGPGFPFVVPRSAKRIIESQLRAGNRSVQDLSSALEAKLITPQLHFSEELLNVNTPADYKRAVQIWTERRRSDAVLEVRNLKIRRGDTHLLSGFSWKVARDEHWVILGPNGCGKTSLFAALLGYLSPTAGDVFVLGEEFGNSDWAELRKKIGLVSSSVRQMMAESEPAWITVASGKYAMIDFWGTPKKSDRAEALRILRETEAEHLAERPWAVLSQGERQRILIGRALMARPALLILDEPCAGLDPAAREHFLDFLERLGRKKNAPSLVLVTHHVEEIMPVFSHVLIMKVGGKLCEGPIDHVLNSKSLSEAFGTEMRLSRNAGRYALTVKSNPRVII